MNEWTIMKKLSKQMAVKIYNRKRAGLHPYTEPAIKNLHFKKREKKKCSKCDNQVYAKGLCKRHYDAQYKRAMRKRIWLRLQKDKS